MIVTDPFGSPDSLPCMIADGPQIAAPRLRVLLVEDEPLVRLLATDLLTDLGHAVIEAGSLAEAEARLASESIDLMISDLGLPDGSAAGLIRNTVARFPAVRILVTSGRDVRSEFGDLIVDGRVEILAKPYDLGQMEARVVGLMAAR